MGLYDFNILDQIEKANILWQKGTYLTCRKEGGYLINLYAIYSFYIEIWYNLESNSIEKILSYKSVNRLDTFLENIEPI